MHAPSVLDVAFLLYLLVLLPFGAIRSAPLLKEPPADQDDPGPGVTRMQAMASTLVMLIVTLAFAWITGAARDFEIFTGSPLDLRAVTGAAFAFGLAIAVRSIVLQMTDHGTLRIAVTWLPRTARERALGVATVVAAGVAEEAAFRGVAVAILIDTFDLVWPAVLLSSVAFTLAHFAQEWKAMGAAFVFALTMHALVWWTGGLLAAMLVHAVYDMVAGYLGVRMRRRYAES